MSGYPNAINAATMLEYTVVAPNSRVRDLEEHLCHRLSLRKSLLALRREVHL